MSTSGYRGVPEEPGMWQQFRRRRVSRTVVIYLAWAYMIVQAALSLATVVTLPPWGIRAVVGVLVLGFPFTVVLAWSFDVTRSGIVKTPELIGPEQPKPAAAGSAWLVGSGVAILIGLILQLLRG